MVGAHPYGGGDAADPAARPAVRVGRRGLVPTDRADPQRAGAGGRAGPGARRRDRPRRHPHPGLRLGDGRARRRGGAALPDPQQRVGGAAVARAGGPSRLGTRDHRADRTPRIPHAARHRARGGRPLPRRRSRRPGLGRPPGSAGGGDARPGDRRRRHLLQRAHPRGRAAAADGRGRPGRVDAHREGAGAGRPAASYGGGDQRRRVTHPPAGAGHRRDRTPGRDPQRDARPDRRGRAVAAPLRRRRLPRTAQPDRHHPHADGGLGVGAHRLRRAPHRRARGDHSTPTRGRRVAAAGPARCRSARNDHLRAGRPGRGRRRGGGPSATGDGGVDSAAGARHCGRPGRRSASVRARSPTCWT